VLATKRSIGSMRARGDEPEKRVEIETAKRAGMRRTRRSRSRSTGCTASGSASAKAADATAIGALGGSIQAIAAAVSSSSNTARMSCAVGSGSSRI
jgi:hypothetical protein